MKINSILKEVLEKIKPPKEDLNFIDSSMKEFLRDLKKRIKNKKIKADIFIGGSFAKETVILKDYYDADVFVRFDKKYPDKELSNLMRKILQGINGVLTIHGSRNYFRIKKGSNFIIEIIPVKKISNPKEAENITDLSYSHVNYIKKRIKNKKILDEIRIAKAFCYATNTYGAESYIGGFSGYALELLVYYYGGFLKFIKAISKLDSKKEIIDIEKYYKRKSDILLNVNASKLASPIILIDPTYPQRNALAALSNETFDRFKQECKKFLKNPSIKSFEIEKKDIEKIKEQTMKKKQEFVLIHLNTNKQEGDVAGSKLLKFFKYFGNEISKYFKIIHNGFEYDGGKSAITYFVAESKKEILFTGPFIEDKESSEAFKKEHKKTFEKNKRLYAKEKIDFDLKEFVSKWKNKYPGRLKEMSITGLRID